MNEFLKNTMNVSETWNGALSYLTTNSACVDQFGKAGSYRGRELSQVFQEQQVLWNENKEFAVKFPFYLRMITRTTKLPNGESSEKVQKGQGARDESFKRLLWFAHNEPELFYNNLWLLPIVGSWKDLWTLLSMDDSLNHEKIFTVIAEGCENDSQRELVKKYLPQIRANKKCTTKWAKTTNDLAKEFCKWAGWSPRQYRQFKSSGKAHEFQKFISTRQYDKLDWNKISGKALLNLCSSKFLDNQNLSENYLAWISQTPVAKFNGYPYELGQKLKYIVYSNNINSKITKMTVDAQFENLIKTGNKNNSGIKGNVWCALDTSGSMGCIISKNNLTAFDVCVSLGIYFSTLNEGAFHKNVIMFDSDSRVKQLVGTFSEMYSDIVKSNTAWGSTNFMSIINEIIRIRKSRPNIPLTDYPTTLLVVSDLQFDSCGSQTNYERMKEILYSAFPKEFVDNMKFVWWQVNGRNTKDVPATLDDGGCYFFSGFDGAVISLLLSGETVVNPETGERKTPTMQELIEIAMNQEVLQLLKF